MVVFQAQYGSRSGGLLKKKDTDLTKLKRPSRRHKRLKSLTISYSKTSLICKMGRLLFIVPTLVNEIKATIKSFSSLP